MCRRITDEILDELAKSGPTQLPRRGLVRIESGQPGDWRYLSIGRAAEIKLTRYLPPAETITLRRGGPTIRQQLEILKGCCWITLPVQHPRNDVAKWQEVISTLDASHSGPCSGDVTAKEEGSIEETDTRPRWRGSQKHVRDLISSRDFLDRINSLIGKVGGSISSEDHIRPSAGDNFREWELPSFLKDAPRPPINASHFYGWWPNGGPKWDIICTCRIDGRPGLLLVEAKAHTAELVTLDRSDANVESLAWIVRSLDAASEELQSAWPGTSLSAEHHYQLSNRVAWAWKAANAGVPVILLYLGFTGDNDVRPGCGFLNHEHWLREVQKYAAGVIPPVAVEAPVKVANGGSLRLLVWTLPAKPVDGKLANEIISFPLPIHPSPHEQFCELPYDEAANLHEFTLTELFKTRILGCDPRDTALERIQALEEWGIISQAEQALLNEFAEMFLWYDDLSLSEIIARCESICTRLQQIPAHRVAQTIAELALRTAQRERATLDGGEAGPSTTVEGLADRAVRAFCRLPTAEGFENPVEVAFSGAVAGALVLAEFGECSAYHGAVIGAVVSALHSFDIPRF